MAAQTLAASSGKLQRIEREIDGADSGGVHEPHLRGGHCKREFEVAQQRSEGLATTGQTQANAARTAFDALGGRQLPRQVGEHDILCVQLKCQTRQGQRRVEVQQARERCTGHSGAQRHPQALGVGVQREPCFT